MSEILAVLEGAKAHSRMPLGLASLGIGARPRASNEVAESFKIKAGQLLRRSVACAVMVADTLLHTTLEIFSSALLPRLRHGPIQKVLDPVVERLSGLQRRKVPIR